MEEKEKYWTQRISTSSFHGKLVVCDAFIWKTKPGTLRISVSQATNGKFKKRDGISIRVKNGKVDIFYQIRTAWRSGNSHFETKIPGIGGCKVSNTLLRTINYFLAKNGMPKLPTNKIRAAIRERKKSAKNNYNSKNQFNRGSLISFYNNAALSEMKKALKSYIYPVTDTIAENHIYVDGMSTLLRKKEFNLDEWAKFAVGKKTKKIVKMMREAIDDHYFFRFVGSLRVLRDLVTLDHLYTYGKKLSHCVASYGNKAVNKICQIVAVYRGEELLYNLEIQQKQICQFRGKYNKNPDEGDKELVVEFLKKEGIAA